MKVMTRNDVKGSLLYFFTKLISQIFRNL